MFAVEPLALTADPRHLDSVRALFHRYADFLRSSGGHPAFRFDRFEQEILALPAPYATDNGELLAATQESAVIGCIAYRTFPDAADPTCCEVKRLFVAPEFRGHAIGRRLIRTAIDRARSRGYRLARLDTHPATMPSAHRLYLEEGFLEYEHPNPDAGTTLIYLQKSLC